MRRLFELASTFGRDRCGNMAMIFAIACVPLISFIGCAVDYSHATQIKAKLQAAADAASVGSVARNSPAYIFAGTMSSDGPIAVGVTDATNIFNANVANVTDFTLTSLKPVVPKTGSAVSDDEDPVSRHHRREHDDDERRLGVDGEHAEICRLLSAARQFAVDGRRRDADRRADHGQQHVGQVRFRLPRRVQLEQLLQSRQIARRDDADRRAAHRDPAIDGYGRQHGNLFEPVSHGDLRFRPLGRFGCTFQAVDIAEENCCRARNASSANLQP